MEPESDAPLLLTHPTRWQNGWRFDGPLPHAISGLRVGRWPILMRNDADVDRPRGRCGGTLQRKRPALLGGPLCCETVEGDACWQPSYVISAARSVYQLMARRSGWP